MCARARTHARDGDGVFKGGMGDKSGKEIIRIRVVSDTGECLFLSSHIELSVVI